MVGGNHKRIKGGSMEPEHITLEKVAFGLNTIMSKPLIREMEVSTYEDYVLGAIVHQVRGYLWSNKVHHETTTEKKTYPATMWEELKESFAPRWFKHRFPVGYYTEVIRHEHNHYHMCPHLNIDTQEEHLDFLKYSDSGAAQEV